MRVSNFHQVALLECLRLARQGYGHVSPNPMVGALIFDAQNQLVAQGYHAGPGTPHAEVMALGQAGEKARGGTLYVNLEPCNHHGRTPPCTQAIIDAGIAHVVFGSTDPNPNVAGNGRAELEQAGIQVTAGILEDECKSLNEIFFHHIQTGKPFVSVKLASTLDGRVATRNGESQWLTQPDARRYVQKIRAGYDAILTTATTVLADDPLLNVREAFQEVSSHANNRQPIRIILDRRFRLDPQQYRIFNPAIPKTGETWVFTSTLDYAPERVAAAEAMGVRVLRVRETGVGLSLPEVFGTLEQSGLSSLLVEAGGRLVGELFMQERVHKLYQFLAPMLMTDLGARSGFYGGIVPMLQQVPQFKIAQVHRLSTDLLLEAYPVKHAAPAGFCGFSEEASGVSSSSMSGMSGSSIACLDASLDASWGVLAESPF